MSEYTHTPNTICFKDIEKNDFNLSASQYNKVIIPNYIKENNLTRCKSIGYTL